MMKLIAVIICIHFFLLPSVGAGDKIELKWNKFNEGLSLAKKENKKILVDIYADWCKWCKKMDAEVFNSDSVALYLDNNYILIKVNGESKENLTYKGETMTSAGLARSFGVSGFPTVIFLEPNGDAITKVPGFIDVQNFLPIIKYFGDGHYKNMEWQEYLDKFGAKAKGTH